MNAVIRLSDAGDIIVRDSGVVLSSHFGDIALEGCDVHAFIRAVVSKIDGARDREAIVAALPGSFRADALRLLDLLEQMGVIEAVNEDIALSPESQRRLFRMMSEAPNEAYGRLRDAAVLVIGLEPWGAAAAAQLALAEVGAIHLVDGESVGRSDLSACSLWESIHHGVPRAQALHELLRRAAPQCEVSHSVNPAEGVAIDLTSVRQWDLIVGGLPAKDVRSHLTVAAAAHEAQLPYLLASLNAVEARVGPLVRPGQTACWNCCRLRLLANSATGWADWAVQEASLSGMPLARGFSGFAPMASMIGDLVANEVLKTVSGAQRSPLDGAIYIQNMATLEASLHPIVPMPWCPTCGGASSMDASPDVPKPLYEPTVNGGALDRFPGVVDQRTGIISAVKPRDDPDPPPSLLKRASAWLANYTDGTYWQGNFDGGRGKGLTVSAAIGGAVGEALERYCAARVPDEGVHLRSLDALDGDVIDPRSLGLYDGAQYDRPGFPYVRFDPMQKHAWVEGRWLGTDSPVWVPALSTYFQSRPQFEQPWCQVTTNGLGAGLNLTAAAMHAIFELIERDALMLTWLARLPGQRVIPDKVLEPELRRLLDELSDCGATVELYLLDVGIPIPAITCLAFGDGHRWPGVTLSSAAHLSPRVAVRNAILEQAFSGRFVRSLMLKGEHPIPGCPEEVQTVLDHALFYVPQSRARGCDFLRAGTEEPRPLSSFEEPLISEEMCAERLAVGGLPVAVVDLTSPDIALSPFRVVRAIAPGAQQPHFGYGLERLGNTRLKRLLSGQSRRDLNLDPHPMC